MDGAGRTVIATVGIDGRLYLRRQVSLDPSLPFQPFSAVGSACISGGSRRLPGDSNLDGGLDLSDTVWLLGHLFLGASAALPCEGGTAASPGRGELALGDANGDGVKIEGCGDACRGEARALAKWLRSADRPHYKVGLCATDGGLEPVRGESEMRRNGSQSSAPPIAPSALALLAGLFTLPAAGCGRTVAPSAGGAPPPIITTSSGAEMVLIPAGEFVMGDAAGAPDEAPPHRVEVSAFYIDRFEVSQGRFERATGYNPAQRERKDDAVDQIRWTEAIDYCNQLSKREGLEPCYDVKTGACRFEATGYRLPTEAEWEYACRAGTISRYFFGDDPALLDPFAWYEKNASKDSRPAGARRPNAWGIHDMAGSLLEWCNDRYGAETYARSPSKDPTGPADGKDRVLRGGCFKMGPEKCRSAVRFHDEPANADSCFGWDSYGFRCVRRAGGAR